MTPAPHLPRVSTTWHKIALAADVVLVALLAVQLADDGLADSTAGVLKVVALAAAAVFAIVFYGRWGNRRHNSRTDHAGVALALVGGAFVVAAVFSQADGKIFGSIPLVVAGLVLTSLATMAGRLSIVEEEKGRA